MLLWGDPTKVNQGLGADADWQRAVSKCCHPKTKTPREVATKRSQAACHPPRAAAKTQIQRECMPKD